MGAVPWWRRIVGVAAAVLMTAGLGCVGPGNRPAQATPEPTHERHRPVHTTAAALNSAVDRLRLRAELSTESYNTVADELTRLRSRTVVSAQRLDTLRADARRVAVRNAARVRLMYQSQGGYGVLGALVDGGTPQDVLDRAALSATGLGNNAVDSAAAGAATREGLDVAATIDAA